MNFKDKWLDNYDYLYTEAIVSGNNPTEDAYASYYATSSIVFDFNDYEEEHTYEQ